MIILAKFTEDRINEILYDVRKAVHELQLQNLNDEGFRIQMPSYFSELLIYNNQRFVTGFSFDKNNLKCFGIEVVPSYDNFIVVYHKDMPLYQNTAYQVIDLK